jgi:hypothetical protein
VSEVVQIVSHGSNRVGKFNLSHELMGSAAERPMVDALLSLCNVILRDEHESGRGMEYIATSDLFQPLVEGEEIPHYRIEYAFDMAFDNPELEANRTTTGKFGFVAIRQNIVRVPAASLGHAVNLIH